MNAIKYGNQIISYTQLFDRLRHENPAALGKVVSLYGELTRDSLGIRKEDYEEVVKNVSVVFNLAASLKLEADLRTAVEHNTIGTLKLLTFAKTFEKLEVIKFCNGKHHYFLNSCVLYQFGCLQLK